MENVLGFESLARIDLDKLEREGILCKHYKLYLKIKRNNFFIWLSGLFGLLVFLLDVINKVNERHVKFEMHINGYSNALQA